MNLDDTPAEAAFRADARAWLAEHAKPLRPDQASHGWSEFDDADEIAAARAWQRTKAEAGWACITWPVEYHGRGGTPMQSVIFRQEESRFATPPDVFTAGVGMGGPTLLVHGTDDQKTRFLPSMAAGDDIWCQLFSEPGAGSDLAALRTTAVKDGDEWLVNGQKIWSSAANVADWGLLLARTDHEAPKHAGLTYFLVDLRSPGVEVRPIRQITGGANFNEVFLDDVRISDADRVGDVGGGWKVALTTLQNERAQLGEGGTAGVVNVRNLIELARETTDERGSLLDRDGIREQIADCYVQSKGIVYSSLRALTALSQGKPSGPEASIGKLVTGRLRQRLTALGLELHGAHAVVDDAGLTRDDGAWQHAYLFAPAARLAGGTDEIIRNIIGEQALGLPPEPRVDKGVPFRTIPTGPTRS